MKTTRARIYLPNASSVEVILGEKEVIAIMVYGEDRLYITVRYSDGREVNYVDIPFVYEEVKK